MKNTALRVWFWLSLMVISYPVCAHQQITDVPFSHGFGSEKIYVSPEEIVITPEAIFLLLSDGTLVPTLLVSIDTGGLYVIAAKYQCPACGWGNSDNVCINRRCPLYGK